MTFWLFRPRVKPLKPPGLSPLPTIEEQSWWEENKRPYRNKSIRSSALIMASVLVGSNYVVAYSSPAKLLHPGFLIAMAVELILSGPLLFLRLWKLEEPRMRDEAIRARRLEIALVRGGDADVDVPGPVSA